MTDEYLIAMLRNNVGVSEAACRAAKAAADRIEQLVAERDAATAAAYEVAAREVECGCGAGPCQDTANCAAKDAAAIRDLATPDQRSALECFMGLDRIGDIKDAIAALPSVKQTGAVTPAVKAKPLVWEDGQHDRKFSKTPIGQYSARDFGEGSFWADYNGQLLRPSNYTLEAAKSVAQADYEARILAALEPTPDPRDEVIKRLVEALEITRETAHSMAHSEFDGVWDQSDFDNYTPEADAALAAAKEVLK